METSGSFLDHPTLDLRELNRALEAPTADRREAVRATAPWRMPIRVGRFVGTLMDLSRTGMRIRHTVPAANRERVVIRIQWGANPIVLTAFVVSSTVISLGRDNTGTIYETRLQLQDVDDETALLLDRIVNVLPHPEPKETIMRILTLIAEATESPFTLAARSEFIRCRLVGATWQKERVVDPNPPTDGFLLPASLPVHTLDEICRCYEGAAIDTRYLIHIALGAGVSPSTAPRQEEPRSKANPADRFRIDGWNSRPRGRSAM